ncbi:uncharacterized protein TNCV_513351 [Trichonephila clavipes]|nr:uncharacterized protein TNCV_513351 [Trichonephila clavipes]
MRLHTKERGLVMGRVGRTRENPKALEKPRVMRKRLTPVPPQGIKRTVPSSITSRNHKYRSPNNPSQGTESIPGTSQQLDVRQCNPHTEEGRQGSRVQYDRARGTRRAPSKGHSAAEGRPVWSRQTTAVRPCPFYLRSRLKEPEGIPEDQRSTGIKSTAEQPQEKEPQYGSLRRRSGG